ncbi:uncharacterized protein TM35_000761120, partial [Trypanosoma theileri]
MMVRRVVYFLVFLLNIICVCGATGVYGSPPPAAPAPAEVEALRQADDSRDQSLTKGLSTNQEDSPEGINQCPNKEKGCESSEKLANENTLQEQKPLSGLLPNEKGHGDSLNVLIEEEGGSRSHGEQKVQSLESVKNLENSNPARNSSNEGKDQLTIPAPQPALVDRTDHGGQHPERTEIEAEHQRTTDGQTEDQKKQQAAAKESLSQSPSKSRTDESPSSQVPLSTQETNKQGVAEESQPQHVSPEQQIPQTTQTTDSETTEGQGASAPTTTNTGNVSPSSSSTEDT